jgi:hypothetical protein
MPDGRLMVRCYVGKAVNPRPPQKVATTHRNVAGRGNDAGYGNQKCIGWMGARIV